MQIGMNIDLLLDALADRVAERVSDRLNCSSASTTVKPRLLTVEQAAGYLGRSKSSVQHMVAEGVLPTVRSDRRVFLDLRDLDLWIERHKEQV